jgi:hypothetical protein
MIYLIYNTENKAVKIGYSNNPQKRLVSLQTSNSSKLMLIHTEEGDIIKEKLIHYELNDARLSGEWFIYDNVKDRLLDLLYNFSGNIEVVYEQKQIKIEGIDIGDFPYEVSNQREGFCKLYCSPEKRLLTNRLSLRAKEMLLWIQYEIDHGKDFLWMNKKRYMEELEIKSINTYKEALKELIRHGFITPTLASDYYWINPDFMFKGDRVKKYPKNVVKI